MNNFHLDFQNTADTLEIDPLYYFWGSQISWAFGSAILLQERFLHRPQGTSPASGNGESVSLLYQSRRWACGFLLFPICLPPSPIISTEEEWSLFNWKTYAGQSWLWRGLCHSWQASARGVSHTEPSICQHTRIWLEGSVVTFVLRNNFREPFCEFLGEICFPEN